MSRDQITALINTDFTSRIQNKLDQAKSWFASQVGPQAIRQYIASTDRLLQKRPPPPLPPQADEASAADSVPIIEEEEEEEPSDVGASVEPQGRPQAQWDAISMDPPARGEKARPASPNDSGDSHRQPIGSPADTDDGELGDLFAGLDVDSEEIHKGNPPKQPLRTWKEGDEEEEDGLPHDGSDAFD
jgi:hypothetical protein